MRQIGLLVGLLVLVLVFATEVLADGTTTIRGYGVREFAIKSDPDPGKNIEEHAEELYLEIKNDKARKPDTMLQVWIEGFADKTGPEAENDEWGEKRARQIKSFLSGKFSDAKIESISRGTSRNMRAVFVEWKYVPIPVTPSPVMPVPAIAEKSASAEGRTVSWAAGALAIGAVITLIFILLSLMKWHVKWQRKVKNLTEPEPEQWIKDLDVGGQRYEVKIEVNEKFWKSPFVSNSGIQIVRDSKRRLVESLKGCLKKDEFKPQKEELIRNGVIKIVQ